MTFTDLLNTEQELRAECDRLRGQLDKAEELLDDVRISMDLLGLPEAKPAAPKPKASRVASTKTKGKPKARRNYTPEQQADLKRQVVAEVAAGGTIASAERRLNMGRNLVHAWKKADPDFAEALQDARMQAAHEAAEAVHKAPVAA